MPVTNPIVGQRIRFVPKAVYGIPPFGFENDQEVTVTAIPAKGFVNFVSDDAQHGTGWSNDWFLPVESLEEPTRPTLVLNQSTAQAYAREASSTALSIGRRELLESAAAGEPVDALEFRRALDYALRLAATRYSNSHDRRSLATHIGHLAHKVNAVLENAIEQLPPVEPGQRSPKIKALEEELEVRKDEVELLKRHLAEVKAEREDYEQNQIALKAEREDYEQNQIALVQAIHDDRTRFVKVLRYARTHLLDEAGRARLDGYDDGIREA